MLHVYNNVTLHLSILYYHTNTNITVDKIIFYYIIIASTAAKYTNNNHHQQSQSPAEAEVPVFIVHVLITPSHAAPRCARRWGRRLLNAQRWISVLYNFDRLPESFLVRNWDSREAKLRNVLSEEKKKKKKKKKKHLLYPIKPKCFTWSCLCSHVPGIIVIPGKKKNMCMKWISS